MRVKFSLDIEDDLDAIAEYTAVDSPRRAAAFIREINAQFRRIGDGPLLYQLRPDIGQDARLAVVGNYVVLFRVASDVVYVERVIYGGRDLPSLYR
jgi:toxin ParE1/3/4